MPDTMENRPPVPWVLITVLIALAGIGAYAVRNVLFDNGPQEKVQITAVTLVRPTPPPMQEKPPEPIIEDQQDGIIDTGAKNDPDSASDDNEPAGNDLGVDAEGIAGSDGFGLVGKKGGRSIFAGAEESGGGVSLLARFAGYTQVVTGEIKRKVMKQLDEEGGIPKGKLQCVVRVRVNIDGKVTDCRITGSSGNTRMDDAVIRTLRSFRASEPPPEDMPRTMDIKIISQG